MEWQWRVTIPSTAGRFSIFLDGESGPGTHAFEYGLANSRTAKSLTLAWVSLLADNPIAPLPPKIYARFVNRLGTDIFGVIKSYSDLANTLMKSERTDDDGCVVRSYIKGLEKTPAFRVYIEWYRTGNPVLLRWLLSFLCFGKVAKFERPELETSAFTDWYKNEIKLEKLNLSVVALDNLRRVTSWLLEGYNTDLSKFTPHHGPGFTAERVGRGVEEKNHVLAFPSSLKERFLGYGSYSLYPDFQGYYDFDDRPAELTFVPKDHKSLRTINMLPAGTMYLEQGVRDQLYAFFEDGRIGRFCALRDQRHNQHAARIGSMTGKVDTIDMSSASDLVSWSLITSTFPSTIMVDLETLRSSRVHYDGIIITQRKFAPMGSALCFPVQCIVFCAIVIASGLSQSLGQDMQVDNLPDCPIEELFHQNFSEGIGDSRSRYAYPTIYGDDVCLDNRLTLNAVRNLESMGFVVNVGKSFTGSDTFRESCGKFYSRGSDVSMLKYRGGIPKTGKLSIADLAGVIDQANAAHDFGYSCLRRYYIQMALRHPVFGVAPQSCGRNPVLFSNGENETMAIKFDTGTLNQNRHLRRNWDTHLYEGMIQSISVMPSDVVKHTLQYENYSYLQWQRAQWYGHNDPPVWEGSVRADYRGVVPAFRWTRVRDTA